MHKKLFHINLTQHYQFITFRTKDSIDGYVNKIQNLDIQTKAKQYKIDKYLDNSTNGAYFFGDKIEIMRDIIFEKNSLLYELEVVCIMPNHVHLLLQQKDDISKIMKFLKGKSGVELNKSLLRSGTFWAEGYYDKAIRNQKHYDGVFEYIVNNPVKANLKEVRVFSRYEL